MSPDAALGLDPGEPYDASPPEPRPGWVVAPPDFVIVGAQDAGGERLATLLAAHPSVHEVRPELRAWERFFETWPSDPDIDRYRRCFPRPAGQQSGELAATTMSLFWAPRMLATAAPQARILMMLRDPATRYLAGRGRLERYRPQAPHWHYGPRSFTHWAADRSFSRGEYALQVQWIRDAFPDDRIMILQQEALDADPVAMLARIQAFLGLDSAVPDAALVAGSVTLDAPAPELEPQRLAAIRDLYRHDVQRLRTLVPDLDVSLWPNYQDEAQAG